MAEKQLWLQWQEDMRAEGRQQERDRISELVKEDKYLYEDEKEYVMKLIGEPHADV